MSMEFLSEDEKVLMRVDAEDGMQRTFAPSAILSLLYEAIVLRKALAMFLRHEGYAQNASYAELITVSLIAQAKAEIDKEAQ